MKRSMNIRWLLLGSSAALAMAAGGCAQDATMDETGTSDIDSALKQYGEFQGDASVCFDEMKACMDEADGMDAAKACKDAFKGCLPQDDADGDDDGTTDEGPGDGMGPKGDGKGPKGKKPPFGKLIHGCLEDLAACIVDGGEPKECVEGSHQCIKDTLKKHFAMKCKHALEKCAEKGNPETCEKIAEKCESGLPPFPPPGPKGDKGCKCPPPPPPPGAEGGQDGEKLPPPPPGGPQGECKCPPPPPGGPGGDDNGDQPPPPKPPKMGGDDDGSDDDEDDSDDDEPPPA